MKHILIVMPNLTGGGAEKSLVTLLHVLGEQYGGGRDFCVDLLVFLHEGLFMAQAPAWVNLLPPAQDYTDFMASMHIDSTLRSVLYFLRRRQCKCAWARVLYRLYKLHTRTAPSLGKYQWKCIRGLFPKAKTHYDAAVAYLEGYATFYVDEKVQAFKKITYYHSDYSTPMAFHSANPVHYPHFDSIVSISDACCNALRDAFPALANRVVKIENIVSPSLLQKLAAQGACETQHAVPVILTIARLSEAKGVDLAVRAGGILKCRGLRFRWNVIGGAKENPQFCALINEEDVADCFALAGESENPAPALAACDIYVQPSRWEGKCIALEEAKALRRPIVCTRFRTAPEQIDDGHTGILCAVTPEGIAEAVQQLLENAPLRQQLHENLEGLPGNEAEAAKFLHMLGI